VVVASAGGEIDLPRGCVEEPTHPSGETRVEAIHIYGTDNMSTDQVMNLFADYVPSHLEWINDSSCNVVWQVRTWARQPALSTRIVSLLFLIVTCILDSSPTSHACSPTYFKRIVSGVWTAVQQVGCFFRHLFFGLLQHI
jgi:hypothetical protein